jgi:hypothetical protein
MAGLLPACPDDPHVLAVARRLLEAVRLGFAPRKVPRLDQLASAEALLTGVVDAGARVLLPAVAPFRGLAFKETPALRPRAAALRALVARVFDEL